MDNWRGRREGAHIARRERRVCVQTRTLAANGGLEVAGLLDDVDQNLHSDRQRTFVQIE